jgi:uncharacterized membrane protein
MSLESNKTLGGIGAILVAIGYITFFTGYGAILGIVGIILVLVAMKGLAEYYDEQAIFDNALYGFIFGIIGIISLIAIIVLSVFTGLSMTMMMSPQAMLGAFVGWLILGFIMFVAFIILQAVFYRKAFSMLSSKSDEKMFDTGGLLLLIGAILTIIVIGVVIILIAWILIAVGFFSIKISVTQQQEAQPPPPPPPPS